MIRERCKACGTELEIVRQTRFSMSVVGGKNSNSRQVKAIFQTCVLAWSQQCFTIHSGYIFRCSRAPFIGYRLQQQAIIPNDFRSEDGLKLEICSDFAERARKYFESSTPLKSCSYCLGCVGKRVEHRQMNKDDVESQAWSRRTVTGSIDEWKAFRKFNMWRFLGIR